MERLRINLDIEAIIDVRYGWLRNQSDEMADELLFNFEAYCRRDHDNFWLTFPQVDEETCKKRKGYKLADLKAGVRTNIFNLIEDAIRSSTQRDTDTIGTEITINFRHYQLTDDEIERFKVLVSSRFNHEVIMHHICLPYGKMNPKYIVDNFDLNIYYDFVGWLKLYWSAIAENPIPRVVFYVPFLFPDKVECERNFYRLINESGIDSPPLEIISDALSGHLKIYFENMTYFSPITVR